MKFPRNARIFSGQLDPAPFITVFFLLVIFVMLGSLVYTPGVAVQIQLPAAEEDTAGVDGATIAVAVDAAGKFYFQNQVIAETDLQARLRLAVLRSREPVTLVVFEDKAATRETKDRLASLARQAGIKEIWEATLPRPVPTGLQNP